jgi:glyoxylase-like metal-dependent hydrolase (beta-lactamase superfamily II)
MTKFTSSLTRAVLVCLLATAASSAHAELLPLPEGAQPVEMPAEGYIIQRAGETGYVVIANGYQATFVVTDDGVVLIDAPPALASVLAPAIKSVTDKAVTTVIYTHDHFDHIGATTDFAPTTIIAHEDTAKLLEIFPDPKRPAPTQTFSGETHSVTIGGTEFDLIYPGPNHEAGNIIISVPSDRLVVMADLVMPGWAPWRGWGNGDHIPGILQAHDAILALDFDTYVGGHVYRTGTRADVEDSRAFWVDLWTLTQEAMGTTPFEASPDGNSYNAQDTWFNAVADKAHAQLIEKWGKRLGGVDTGFTHDTIVAAAVSLWTDTPNIPAAALTK